MTEPTRESGDMRAAFEAWAKENSFDIERSSFGHYHSSAMQRSWFVWQAAIATTQRDLDAARVALVERDAEIERLRSALQPFANMRKHTVISDALSFRIGGGTAADVRIQRGMDCVSISAQVFDDAYTALKEPSA